MCASQACALIGNRRGKGEALTLTITIITYSELKEFLGQNGKVHLEVDPGTTLGEIVNKLGIPRDLIMNIVCGHKLENFDSTVQDGCVYQILPLIGGG